MQTRRSIKRVSDIRTRIGHALRDRRFGGMDLGDILDHACETDVDTVKPFLRGLLVHQDWTVRVDALEFVGRFHLREFLRSVKSRLGDENRVVRDYALTAYYDLLGPRALPLIEEVSKAGEIGNRVTASALRYVETKDEAVFEQLSKILTRRRCRFTHRYAAMSIFDAYLDVGRYPEIIKLFETIQRSFSEVPRTYGLDKDIPKMLDKWKRSRKGE